ncbi:MAG: hypothetical protein HOV77_25300 [Hamadaea sp.]|uniref:hypothetical protein n=1 Tax=Hamadaea sp. TaxID=2024425 RepID=UPI0018503ED5|nr:hypothetical protein [Hamadaea sp.]NUT22502.1 hypothetical protein [Hamadaea sp.]
MTTPFFVSYASPVPSNADTRSPWPSHGVAPFYADLCRLLGVLTGGRRPVRGFLDLDLPDGVDLDDARRRAMDSARVFVPLYSPVYFRRLPAEYAVFHQREVAVLPVLWTAFGTGEHAAETEAALEVVDDPQYAENGLRALRMLKAYDESYAVVMEALAVRLGQLLRPALT